MSTVQFFKLYYYITPLFIFIDITWDQTFRAAVIDNTVYQYYYYGLCLFCALICLLKPRLSPVIALTESSINMMILILSFMLPIITIGEQLENNDYLFELIIQKLISFIVIGVLIIYSFYTALYDITVIDKDYNG